MRVITQKEIEQINQLYLKTGSYAAVSRALEISPYTVKKYVVNGHSIVEEANVERFNAPLPEFDEQPFRAEDWNALCELDAEEIKEVEGLRKELEA